MKLSLDLRTSLTMKLTPQQIQYLKLLQLPIMQLEQQVSQELEQNPMLEENESTVSSDDDSENSGESLFTGDNDSVVDDESSFKPKKAEDSSPKIEDSQDPFEFYKMVWQDDSSYSGKSKNLENSENDNEPFQIKDNITIVEDLVSQLRMFNLSNEDNFLGEQIIGNVDADGYLRREVQKIVDETNSFFAEINLKAQQKVKEIRKQKAKIDNTDMSDNPARQFAISDQAMSLVSYHNGVEFESNELDKEVEITEPDPIEEEIIYLKPVTIEDAERLLKIIITLDPPGIGSRTVQECLLSQCKSIRKPNAAQKLATVILSDTYDAFAMKHYSMIIKQLDVTEDYLREAIDFIRTLNPKPGGGDYQSEMNTVIPDFTIERDKEKEDLIITVNDSRIPSLQLSTAYEKVKKEAKFKHFNKETREWIRNKYSDAKFLIQAIRQRKSTMLKVMTAIAGLQRDFYFVGHDGLKPLIYKDVAEDTGLDISTICRIVNGKYVQTEFGTFELKFFFSESLPSEDGEEISTTIVKNIIKEIIEKESKSKPLSDDKICKELNSRGFKVARRTVAKYREQMKIPVARLRKEL